MNPTGVRKDLADDAAVTVAGGYAASVALHRNAIALAIRTPAVPKRGDSALARDYFTDPLTNITFEVAVYAGQRCTQVQVSVVWGVKAVNGEHIALLLG